MNRAYQTPAQSRLELLHRLTLPDSPTINTAALDPSLLSLYRDLSLLRQLEPALASGDYRELQVEGDLLVYERHYEHQRFVVALNFGGHALPVHLRTAGAIAASTNPERPIGDHDFEESKPLATTLQPFEGILVRIA
jgi:glycosidase